MKCEDCGAEYDHSEREGRCKDAEYCIQNLKREVAAMERVCNIAPAVLGSESSRVAHRAWKLHLREALAALDAIRKEQGQ